MIKRNILQILPASFMVHLLQYSLGSGPRRRGLGFAQHRMIPVMMALGPKIPEANGRWRPPSGAIAPLGSVAADSVQTRSLVRAVRDFFDAAKLEGGLLHGVRLLNARHSGLVFRGGGHLIFGI